MLLRMKRKTTAWVKIFVYHMCDKDLVLYIYIYIKKELPKLNNSIIGKQVNQFLKNKQNIWIDTLPKKTYKWQT